MKIIFVLSFFLSFINTSHGFNSVTYCLGKEEEFLFKNRTKGPIVNLNRSLQQILLTNPAINLPSIRCSLKTGNSPSFDLIKSIVLNQTISSRKLNRSKFALLRLLIDSFLSYLSELNALFPTSDCIPGIVKNFGDMQERYLYVSDQIKIKKFLQLERPKFQRIFNVLKNPYEIYNLCEKEKKERLEYLRKKYPKSGL